MSKSKSKSRKNTTLKIRQRRNFTETFKREKVEELTSGLYSISSFCKLWDLSLTANSAFFYAFYLQKVLSSEYNACFIGFL
jgi:transposase